MMKFKKHSIKRKLIQIAAFGITNSQFQNFASGKIYTGEWKNFCNPGLNCYSCPAAALSCPIGALQAVNGSMNFNFSFYVVGFLLAIGVLLGRWVCGFLCPFGLLQELIHKIPLPFKKPKLWRGFKYLKYIILAVFVFILPITLTNYAGMGKPAFCEFICPAGIIEGCFPLMLANESLRSMIGILFSTKLTICILVIILCIFFYRFFCKAMCPLGAIYGLLNKVSLYSIRVDKKTCVKCGKCAKVCKMDVDPVHNPNSIECIRCGNCAKACPVGAIHIGFHFKKNSKKKNIDDYKKNIDDYIEKAEVKITEDN